MCVCVCCVCVCVCVRVCVHVHVVCVNKGFSLDITPTSLLHRSVSGGWGVRALLMATSDRPPPLLVILQRWKSHRQLFRPDWGS